MTQPGFEPGSDSCKEEKAQHDAAATIPSISLFLN